MARVAIFRLISLWLAYVAVHFWLIFEAQQNPQTSPFNDVNLYGIWADQVLHGQTILGVNAPWVYPFVALAPIVSAKIIGAASGMLAGWLTLIAVLNLIGLSFLVDWGRAKKNAFAAASFYLLFLALLGPVALGRIDAVAVFFALVGVTLAFRNKARIGMALFTLGAWIKIWPVAAALSIYASVKNRIGSLLAALATSAVLLAVGLLLGGNQNLLSFITTQGNRGLQVESVAATFWVWAAKMHVPGAGIYFDTALVTNQVSGSFTTEVSTLLGFVMIGALAITAWLGFRAHRAGAESKHLFVAVFLTATLDLIVFNKVGSPQFESWLAIPLLAGILLGLPKWRFPLAIGLFIALLTNLIYPIFYMDLMVLGDLGVWLLTLRNALLVILLIWANLRLSALAKQG